jgi:hypothetical protein
LSTEIVRAQPQAASLPEKMEYAKALASSGMLPAQYRGQPANLLWALEFAGALGLHPMTAITGVHVIEGKPSASSALISALVRRAGHKLRVKGDDARAVAQIVRCDDPEFTFECVWTLDRAERAGLLGKGTWKKYPAAMLKARAITEVAREACEEALSGVRYTPEELGAEVDAEGQPVARAEVTRLRPAAPADDEWSTPAAGTGAEQVSAAQEIAQHAAEATTRDRVMELWGLARTGRMLERPVTAPDSGELEELGAYLARRGKALPAAEQQQPAAPAPDTDGAVDAEVLVDEPDADHAAAVAALREFADAAGLDRIEQDAYTALGVPLADASAASIRGLLAQLRGTAA